MEKQRSNQSAPEHFDALVLGSGEAGKYVSWALGSEGKRVALIERRYMGGSCPNIACLPSKNIIHSAKVVHYARGLDAFGLPAQLAPVDMAVVRGRKRQMVTELIKVHEGRFAASHVEFVRGQGIFTAPRTISVQTQDGGRTASHSGYRHRVYRLSGIGSSDSGSGRGCSYDACRAA